jgi:hypothetical protein
MFPMPFQYLAQVARAGRYVAFLPLGEDSSAGLMAGRTLYFLLYVILLFLSDLVYTVHSVYITCDHSLSININTVLTFYTLHYITLPVLNVEGRFIKYKNYF